MKDDYKDGFEQESDYHPASTKGTAAFLVGLASGLFGDTCLYFQFLPGALLFFVVLFICAVWIVKERQRQDRQHYLMYKTMRKRISELKTTDEDLKNNLSSKADKLPKSNIRPGSKPNNEYYKMLIKEEGFHADNRTEDQKSQKS